MGIFLLFLKEKLKNISKKKIFFLLILISLCILLPLKIIQGQIPVTDVASIGQQFLMALLDAALEAGMTAAWFVILLQIIMSLSNLLVGLGGALLNWALVLNTTIPLTRGPIVESGWATARDLANMFFILALVMIAFATILGIESYGMRRFLVPLILIAIFINFSQVFIGAAVDFASVFMSVFAKEVADWGSLVDRGLQMQGEVLKASLTIVGLIVVSIISGGLVPLAMALVGVDPITILATSLFKIIIFVAINVLLAVILLILAGIFLLRIPMLWILTIIAPMMLVCYLFPFLKDKYKWWMNQLSEWIMIGLFSLFFLYIGMGVWNLVWSDEWRTQWDTASFGQGVATLGKFDAAWFANEILPYLVFILFLYLALHFAQKTNAIFAGALIGAGMAMGAGLKGWMEKRARKPPAWVREKALPPEAAARRERMWRQLPFGIGKERAERLRKRRIEATTGKIEEGEKIGKQEIVPERRAELFASEKDSFVKLGMLSAKPEELGRMKDRWRRMGWSEDQIEREIEGSLAVGARYDPSTVKKMVKVDPGLARTAPAREVLRAQARMGEVLERYETRRMLPDEAQERASVRLAVRSVRPSGVPDIPTDFFRVGGNRDDFLRNARVEHLIELGRTNPEAQRLLQNQLDNMGIDGLETTRGYEVLHRMFTDPRTRSRLEAEGWRVPPTHGSVAGLRALFGGRP